MYCDRRHVGAFAVQREALRRGEAGALFQVLVATTLFQRQTDQQVLRILRSIPPGAVEELGSVERLLELVDEGPCPLMRSLEVLRTGCDLGKDPRTKSGRCSARPRTRCHLKRHTEVLRRYGHFGKVPTSLALMLRELGVDSLPDLYRLVLESTPDPLSRALLLEEALSSAWRVNKKIACMFLSAVANPDLSPGLSPWSEGLDWTHFVVVDSNVDLFLGRIGYQGGADYEARRGFIQRLAQAVNLAEFVPGLSAYNPRLVQQAIYLSMSTSNRRTAPDDCMYLGQSMCRNCPGHLSRICPVRA